MLWKLALFTIFVVSPVCCIAQVRSNRVLNQKAISLPNPVYPDSARAVRAAGTVIVAVLVDESGKVVSASAASGNRLLRASAVAAARNAKFNPVTLSGQPVKVSGLLIYNFIALPKRTSRKGRSL